MRSKILENSESISFFIELVVFVFIGVVLLNIVLGFSFKYINAHNLFKKSKLVKVSYTTVNKRVIPSEVFVKTFFKNFSENKDITSYLSKDFQNSLYSEYNSSNYNLDIKNVLGIPYMSKNISFVKVYSNYYTIFMNISGAKIYLNIFWLKVGNSYQISAINPTEG